MQKKTKKKKHFEKKMLFQYFVKSFKKAKSYKIYLEAKARVRKG